MCSHRHFYSLPLCFLSVSNGNTQENDFITMPDILAQGTQKMLVVAVTKGTQKWHFYFQNATQPRDFCVHVLM